MRRVRFKDNPNIFARVTDAEYHRLAEEGLIIKPYDPDRESPPWPDMSGTYVQAPDVNKGSRSAPSPHQMQEA